MSRFLAHLFRFHKPETTGEVLHFKVLEAYMVYHLIWTVWYWGVYTLRITDVVLPLGLAQYVDIRFMFGNALPLANAAVISVLAVLALLRVAPRWTYLVVVLLMHVQYVARYSLGEISHGAHMTGMTVLAFALGMLIFDAPAQRRRFIWGTVVFLVGLSYVSAGLCKLGASGPMWVDGRHLWLWMGEKSIDILSREGAYSANALQQFAAAGRGPATVILTIGLVTELAGFLFWFRKSRWFAAVMLIGMHVGILLTLNIRFDASIAQLAVLGLPWYLLFGRVLDRRPHVERPLRQALERLS